MSTLATDAERMDAANEHTADKHATDATAKDLPNAAEPTDSAPSSASKARKPKAAKSRQDNAGSASTAMVPIGNGEQTPMGASAITPATGLAGAVASPKNTGISPMRGVNLSPASPHITGQKLLAVPKPVQEEDDEDDDVDEDGDADDDTHDFSFINSRGESTNYLDMSTSTLAGLLKNSKLAVKTAAKKIADSEPWTAIVEQQDEMQAGNLPTTVRRIPTLPCSSALRTASHLFAILAAQEDNTKAINLAHTFLKTLEKLDPNAKVVAIKLVETAILHHHHAPAELAKAKEDKRLIAEAYTRVSTHEAEEKAEKAKAAAMKKLRKIEEEEDDVEPSDVARGKGKMRRIK